MKIINRMMILFVIMILLVGCNQTKETDDDLYVTKDDQKIVLNTKVNDLKIDDLKGNEDGSMYQGDGIDIYCQNDIIVKIEVTSDKYHFSNGDNIGMGLEKLKDDDVVQIYKIDSAENREIYGKYGKVFTNKNMKAEYVFENEKLKKVVISNIFEN